VTSRSTAHTANFPRHSGGCLWNGTRGLHGIDAFFQYCEQKSYKIQYRVLASRYRGKTTCTCATARACDRKRCM
jgi:hypothetical protein